ncbi:MAG: hypothetical protein IZT59_00685 [Verrucomicrobia bacterium]|nr:hypothetical protein [Verrucomicrobiota bacterium]
MHIIGRKSRDWQYFVRGGCRYQAPAEARSNGVLGDFRYRLEIGGWDVEAMVMKILSALFSFGLAAAAIAQDKPNFSTPILQLDDGRISGSIPQIGRSRVTYRLPMRRKISENYSR